LLEKRKVLGPQRDELTRLEEIKRRGASYVVLFIKYN
jgi:hypothetical protein